MSFYSPKENDWMGEEKGRYMILDINQTNLQLPAIKWAGVLWMNYFTSDLNFWILTNKMDKKVASV